LLNSQGPLADENPFRFSSEYFDDESGLVYYNFRYYSPELGRWLSRDPIGERGWENLYIFIRNNPINGIDKYGLWPWSSTERLSKSDIPKEILKKLDKDDKELLCKILYNPKLKAQYYDVDEYKKRLKQVAEDMKKVKKVTNRLNTLYKGVTASMSKRGDDETPSSQGVIDYTNKALEAYEKTLNAEEKVKVMEKAKELLEHFITSLENMEVR
jgi:RHS repeat-associated protein